MASICLGSCDKVILCLQCAFASCTAHLVSAGPYMQKISRINGIHSTHLLDKTHDCYENAFDEIFIQFNCPLKRIKGKYLCQMFPESY